MNLLSTIMDKFYCPSLVSTHLDTQIEFGGFCSGQPTGIRDIKLLADFKTQSDSLKALYRGLVLATDNTLGITFKGVSFFNDLFSPGEVKDEDGIHRLYFPAFGYNYPSSDSLAYDWRYLLLAWAIWYNLGKPKVLYLELLYASGHRVQAAVTPEIWEVFEAMVEGCLAVKPKVTPGECCGRCSVCHTCSQFEAYRNENVVVEMDNHRDVAYKLAIERVMIQTRVKMMEQRKAQIDKSLLRMLQTAEEIRVSDSLVLRSNRSKTTAYPEAQKVFNYLSQNGLWNWDFVKIQAGKLNEALASFPTVVKNYITTLQETKATAPSLEESIRGNQHSIANIFKGIHG